jgi:hypothetical protein
MNKLILGGFIMKDMNDIVNELLEDMEVPEDVAVTYEVWAIGYDGEDRVTDTEMLMATFEDPDQAVDYAKALTLADVVNMAADDECDAVSDVCCISIEVETVVPDDEDSTMNIGTIYKKVIDIYENEELPEFVPLSAEEYELLENGDIKVPRSVLNNYNKNDCFTAIFRDDNESYPMTYKIISKTTGDYYICEFV